MPLPAEEAGYYSTRPLEATLNELVDFARIGKNMPRLTVGAANVRTSEMRYFDSREMTLGARHIMASGALPPAFPAVRIDGDLYWDGGILSNTPVEAIFDDAPRRNSVAFAVHIWNPNGPEPETIQQVLNRQKDIQYSSRAVSHIRRQKQIHRLRHIIAELSARLPEAERKTDLVKEMASYGCLTQMHVVRLLAPPLEGKTIPRTLISAKPESAPVGRPVIATPAACSQMRLGKARSILLKVSTFTNAGQPHPQCCEIGQLHSSNVTQPFHNRGDSHVHDHSKAGFSDRICNGGRPLFIGSNQRRR